MDKNEFFHQAALRICGNLEIEVAMQSLLIYMRKIMPVIRMHLQHYDPEYHAMRSIAYADETESRKEDGNKFEQDHLDWVRMLKEPFLIAMANTLKHREILRINDLLADDNRYLHGELRRRFGDEIVGANFGLRQVMQKARQVAPMDSPVLLLGETGTGKDVVANSIHYASSRSKGPFVSVNCGAIADSLIDSELFGHEKGAFTGALSQKRGRFERAHKGTIFLDEIGELPLKAQVRLLRVLQSREIERVGGVRTIPLDIRIIAATNRNLEQMVAEKTFREDLWFRLNVFPIWIPPLRERPMDIPSLIQHFINPSTLRNRMQKLGIDYRRLSK